MKRLVSVSAVLFTLAACGHSAPNGSSANTKAEQAQTPVLASADSCQGRAQSRLSLFDKPDTYPISENEKRNVYLSLYNECMKEYNVQVATAKPNYTYAANTAGSELAGISPAAGGNYAANQQQRAGGITTYPNGTIMIDTANLGNLSPAAGGQNRITGITNSNNGQNGSTVVVVQAPPSAAAVAYAPVPTRPAAIPVEETAVAAPAAPTTQPPVTQVAPYTGNPAMAAPSAGSSTAAATTTPAAPAATLAAPEAAPATAVTTSNAPSPLELTQNAPVSSTETAEAAPAPKKKKAARAVSPTTESSAKAKDSRTRFQRDAVAVDIDLRSTTSLNELKPSAGNVLDSSVNTNKLPAKD